MKYTLEKEGRFKGRWKDEKGYFHRVKPADIKPAKKSRKGKSA
tara:strand:+ start:7870 stop:7998 length:129 start_codon:yes stop_codon:yes gene_type:complete